MVRLKIYQNKQSGREPLSVFIWNFDTKKKRGGVLVLQDSMLQILIIEVVFIITET